MRYYDCGGYPLCSREVLALPALVVDGRVVSAGRRLALDEVKRLLAQ